MTKRLILGLTLVVGVLISACSKNNAESDFETKIVNDGNSVMITNYIGKSQTANIPEKINGKPVIFIGNGAFQGKNLTSVTLPKTIKVIEDSAFQDNQLTSITIPDGVAHIEKYAFVDNKFTSITVMGVISPPSGGAGLDWWAFDTNGQFATAHNHPNGWAGTYNKNGSGDWIKQ